MNKKYLLVFLGILLSIALLIGSSYAYWMMSHTQTNDNIVSSGCFSTSFTEVEDSAINLTSAFPMTDEDGMKTTPYEFTITNTCDTYASFSINMEVLNSTTLSHDLIKAVLDNNTPKVATEYESTTATIDGATSYVLLSGGLDTDESKTFNFRMWIDEAGTVDNAQNKVVNAKIVVVTTASERPPKLTELLLAQYQEDASTGLVKDASNPNLYYYTGTNEQVANNFLWYGGHQWRVIEFDNSAKTITLITQQPLTAIQPASEVWESEEAYNSSYINTWLNDYFYNSLDSSVQATIQDSTFNIGIYNNVSEITTTKKVGLLDQTQYERAGSANSFLDIKDIWWLGNRYSSSNVRHVDNNGYLYSFNPSNGDGVRAVIKISDLTITGGDGTLANNYRTSTKATNTSDIQVGEYINIPYNGSDNACGSDKLCTMRVVSKNDSSVKVVLNGLLSTTSAWAADASDNITTSDTIYANVLNSFIANIDSAYITTGTFGVGMYAGGNSYTVPAATTITANVGLPTVGEMFSGNDIDLSTSSTKTFVDVAIIENPTILSYYWTMNRDSSSYVRYVSNNGGLNFDNPSNSGGARAVFYLKSGTSALTFTGGEGTPQNPYTLN